MPYGVPWVLLLLLALALNGCAANDLVAKRQAEAEAKIEHLIQGSAKREQRQNEFAAQLQARDEQAQAMQLQVKQLQESVRELQIQQDSAKARGASAVTPKIEVVNPVSTAKPGRESGPPADYLKAFGLYSANNCAAAVLSFEEFITANPGSEYAANALFWVGECHVAQSAFQKAKEAFSRLVGSYPSSPKAADAQLKLGYTLESMNEKERALEAFENLITLYPSSPAAVKARERLSAK